MALEMKDQLLDLRGKAYLPVSARIWGFREEHGIETGWAIRTELIEGGRMQGFAVFRAEVVNPEGAVVAVGHGSRTEDALDKYKKPYKDDRFFEFAETKARGRAMEAAGWGTLAAIDGDEDENSLADAPVDPEPAQRKEFQEPPARPSDAPRVQPPQTAGEGTQQRCDTCTADLTAGQVKISIKHFGRPLCPTHQRDHPRLEEAA